MILDLNGTLLHRPDPRKNPTKVICRPHVKRFLSYLFANCKIMIWSSARPHNVDRMVNTVLTPAMRESLVAIWARDRCGLSPEHYNMYVEVYKRLSSVWADPEIQRSHPGYQQGQCWGQHNTVLIDDTILKASSEPHNMIEIPKFEAKLDQLTSDVLPEVVSYLEVVKMYKDVSCAMRCNPFRPGSGPGMDWNEEYG
jgi:hypothetical protein